jgi:hypothetical protein
MMRKKTIEVTHIPQFAYPILAQKDIDAPFLADCNIDL